MKNLFKYIAVLASSSLMVASCAFEEEPAPNEFVAAPEIKVVVDNLKDNSFTVNVAPDGEAAYYSVVVVPAGAIADVDSVELYRLKYQSKILCESISYAEKQSSVFEIKDLTPNADYDIHAVAGGKTGQVGKVTSIKVTTPDAGAPKLQDASFDAENHTIVLSFSEPVKLGTGKFKVDSYSFLNFVALGDTSPSISKEIPAENIKAEGDKVSVVVKDLVYPGAMAALSFDGEAVTDIMGNKAPKVDSFFYPFQGEEPSDNDGMPVPVGVTADIPNVEWEIYGLDKDKLNDNDVVNPLPFLFFEEGKTVGNLPGIALSPKNKTALVADFKYVSKTREIVYSEVSVPIASLQAAVVSFEGKMPDPDDKITITISAGQLQDLWGNKSKAFEQTVVYESLLTPFYGTYNVSGLDPFMGGDCTWQLNLNPSLTKGVFEVENFLAAIPIYRKQFESRGLDFNPIYQAVPVVKEGKLVGLSVEMEQSVTIAGMSFILTRVDIQEMDLGNGPEAVPVPVSSKGVKINFSLQEDGSFVLEDFGAPFFGIYSPEMGGVLDCATGLKMALAKEE